MNTEWKEASFSACIDRIKTPRKIPKKQFLEEGLYPVVSQEKGLINGYWSKEEDVFSCPQPIIVFGDHTKILKFVDFDFVAGADGVKILKPKPFLFPKYFYYFLRSLKIENLGYARHFRLLKEQNVKYPSMSEQQRIVAILDDAFERIDAAIANTEKNLANARELFESYLNDVFAQKGEGWEEKEIGKCCNLKSGTSVKASLEQESGDMPYIKVADMSYPGNESSINSSSRFLDNVSKKQVFPIGTTIFPKRGGAIMTNKKRITAVPICADLNVMGVIPFSEINPDFLFFYFQSIDMRQLGSGTTIPQINNYDIAPLTIAFPRSIDDQQKIVDRLSIIRDQAEELELIYKQKLSALTELKQSILQKAFAGELTADMTQEALVN